MAMTILEIILVILLIVQLALHYWSLLWLKDFKQWVQDRNPMCFFEQAGLDIGAVAGTPSPEPKVETATVLAPNLVGTFKGRVNNG